MQGKFTSWQTQDKKYNYYFILLVDTGEVTSSALPTIKVNDNFIPAPTDEPGHMQLIFYGMVAAASLIGMVAVTLVLLGAARCYVRRNKVRPKEASVWRERINRFSLQNTGSTVSWNVEKRVDILCEIICISQNLEFRSGLLGVNMPIPFFSLAFFSFIFSFSEVFYYFVLPQFT